MKQMGFFENKRMFITGHMGFKGSWLCKILTDAGARVIGYSIEPPEIPRLFDLSGIGNRVQTTFGDIRDYQKLRDAVKQAQPEIVIHMAAQPLVRESYANPRYTFETNIMGTVNILESIREAGCVRSFLNVTTDKVYENKELARGYNEMDALDGADPYSNSKSCSELVTHSYRKSFLAEAGTAVSTARAGNVIGGGDFAADRILPDCIRAAKEGETIIVRNPKSVRPYQHVLEPLFAYLMILEKQYNDIQYADAYNIGPLDKDCVTTAYIAETFCRLWGGEQKWEYRGTGGPAEAKILELDCAKIRNELGWTPRWDVAEAVGKTIEWTKNYFRGEDMAVAMKKQIDEYLRGGEGTRD